MIIHYYKENNSPYWVVAWAQEFFPYAKEEISTFCYNMFGPGLGEHRVNDSPFVHRWINDIKWGEIRFSREEDLMLFLLRWM